MNPPEGSKPGDPSHVKVSLSAWRLGVRGFCHAFGAEVLGVFRKERKGSMCLIPQSRFVESWFLSVFCSVECFGKQLR